MDNTSFKLLKLYASRSHLSLSDLSAIYNSYADDYVSPVKYLMDEKYLKMEPNYVMLHGADFTVQVPFEIAFKGRAALEAERKSRLSFKQNELRAWLTLGIALAAFLKSFFF